MLDTILDLIVAKPVRYGLLGMAALGALTTAAAYGTLVLLDMLDEGVDLA